MQSAPGVAPKQTTVARARPPRSLQSYRPHAASMPAFFPAAVGLRRAAPVQQRRPRGPKIALLTLKQIHRQCHRFQPPDRARLRIPPSRVFLYLIVAGYIAADTAVSDHNLSALRYRAFLHTWRCGTCSRERRSFPASPSIAKVPDHLCRTQRSQMDVASFLQYLCADLPLSLSLTARQSVHVMAAIFSYRPPLRPRSE